MSEYSFELVDGYPVEIDRVHDGIVMNMRGHNRNRKLLYQITKENPKEQREFLIEAVHETVYPHMDSPVVEFIIENIVWNLLTQKTIYFLHGNKKFRVDDEGNLYTMEKRPRKFDLPNPISFKREFFNINNMNFC